MSTILSQKEPCISANEYISTQECAEEPYVFTKEPYISAKKTYISAKKPSIFQECAALRTLLLGKAMMSTPHVLQCVAVCCSICRSVLQCVAVSPFMQASFVDVCRALLQRQRAFFAETQGDFVEINISKRALYVQKNTISPRKQSDTSAKRALCLCKRVCVHQRVPKSAISEKEGYNLRVSFVDFHSALLQIIALRAIIRAII